MEKVKELAAQYQQAGNNCAETVVKVCNDCLDLKLPPETAFSVAVISQYSSGLKAFISSSRSTIRRVVTDCTRPAESPFLIWSQRNGLIL